MEAMTRQKYHLFAELLQYPGPRLVEHAKECMKLLAGTSQEATSRLHSFLDFVQGAPAGRLEEIYSGTFDLQVVCYPYVGYQLFGESYKRGAFMVALKERYRIYGLSEGNELPDHLGLVLRYLAVLEDDAECEELARQCLIPALEKMASGFRDKDNPYREIICALLLQLQDSYPQLQGAETAFSADTATEGTGEHACAACLSSGIMSEEG